MPGTRPSPIAHRRRFGIRSSRFDCFPAFLLLSPSPAALSIVFTNKVAVVVVVVFGPADDRILHMW